MKAIDRIDKDQVSLHIMILPGVVLLLIFRFFPIYGLQLAFKDMVPRLGVWSSPFIGVKHFRDFFFSPEFIRVMRNTIVISMLKIGVGFPIPILFALMVNELSSPKTRNAVQGIAFMPHFLSWVVVAGIWLALLAKENGVVNDLLVALSLSDNPIHFFGKPQLFRGILVFTETWKDLGWNAIVYIAAIDTIDRALYEAADMDGLDRFKKALHITLPCILPTIVVMLILRVGYILDAGFEQILVFRNPMVYDVSNILDTYVFDTGLKYGRYGYATAVGLFKSIFAFLMVWLTNSLAKKREMGIWQ